MKQLQLTTAAHRLAAVLAIITAIFATSGAGAANVVWNGNAANGSLSDGGNWVGGAAPVAGDTLDFSAVTSATTLNADFAGDRVFATAIFGTGVLTMEGSLHVSTLTNACKLAVASGATLSIDGELVLTQDAGTTASILHSNEGTVVVGGKTRCYTTASATTSYTFYQYDTATANTQPIRTKGLVYECRNSARLYLKLSSRNGGDKAGKWILGSDGFSFGNARQATYSRFYTESNSPVIIGSSADWTLANSGKPGSSGGDLFAQSGASITLDTSDCDDPSIGHTITLKGHALINANAANPGFIVKGCGKVVVNTTGSASSLTEEEQNTCINTALAVTDTATLQVNKGKKIMGSGSVALASGTTLLVPDASATVTLPSVTPVAGSTIVVTNLTAGTPAIALSGSLTVPTEGKVTLKIGGSTQLENGIYTVVSSANALPSDTVDHLTLDASEVVSGDCSLYAKGGALLLLVGISEPGYGIWVGGTDANLSTAANWLNDEVPRAGDTLNFKTVGTATTINADYGNTRVFATAVFGSGVVTLTGSLCVNTLTNAYTLAVASGATLDIAGDLVATVESNGGSRTFLHSNEGTVTVGGKAIGYTNVGGFPDVYEYAAATENTRPIQARGIAYQCGGSGQLGMKLQSDGNTAGSWVVGADGFSFPSSRNANYTTFFAEYAPVTLYSSDDWTLANSGMYNTTRGDLYVSNASGSSLAIDTSDYVTPATRRTVTLKGRIVAYNPVTIKGCGTVVVDTTGSSTHASVPEDFRHTCLTNAATLSVTDTATLQINAGKKITGNGTISLAAGTTLALKSTGREFATPDIVPVTLPAEGAATICIDGTRLCGGEHVLCTLASVPENLADHVTVTGTALDGREYTVQAVEVTENEKTVTKLVLDIQPAGLKLIFR
ncbi:MAG: hypothetical protein IKO55_00350 [Kiritimatiellae bacterium]|nr:hypothetical protein [Kiritimatiellia bacterium]